MLHHNNYTWMLTCDTDYSVDSISNVSTHEMRFTSGSFVEEDEEQELPSGWDKRLVNIVA